MTPKTQKILASQRTAKFPYLIKISHVDYIDMYYANSNEDIVYNNITYKAALFSIQPPDKDGAKIGNATLTISAIDQYWIERIRRITTPAELQFMAVIVYDDQGGYEGVESLEENGFTLRASDWDEFSIKWEMSFDERQANIITSIRCTPFTASGCA